MADSDLKTGGESKNFRVDVPQETPGFFLKGSAHLGWGMKNRLSRIFNPKSGRTVMLAFDHGYIVGPTTGLERLVELVVSKRNAAWAFERGGQEFGQGHFPFMVVLHTGFLFSCVAEVWLMNRADVVLTDSGGVQEEAPSLGKPVLVMRNTTERPEGVDAGNARLVGTDLDAIVSSLHELLEDKDAYNSMANVKNPYGDGTTSKQIIDLITNTN